MQMTGQVECKRVVKSVQLPTEGKGSGKYFLITSNRAAKDAQKVSKVLAMTKALIASQNAQSEGQCSAKFCLKT